MEVQDKATLGPWTAKLMNFTEDDDDDVDDDGIKVTGSWLYWWWNRYIWVPYKALVNVI